MEKEEMAVNSNEKAAENYKKVSGDEFVQAGCYGVDVSEVSSSSLQTVLNRANEFKAQQNANDNNKGGDDNPPPASPNAEIAETGNEDSQTSSYIEIDVDEVVKCTHIQRNELVALCSSTSTAVAIPTDLTQLSTFITVNEGFVKTAVSLANRKLLPSETRSYFLKRAQEYGYLWLKGEAQLGQEIRKIESKQGNRTDLQNSKRKKADLDNVLTELRSKKEILAEDYKIGYTQARQLARLTDELVKKELKYAIDNNDGLSRTHALSFLSQPPELTEEEKETMEPKTAKAKFKVETNYSSVSYEVLKNRVTTEPISPTLQTLLKQKLTKDLTDTSCLNATLKGNITRNLAELKVKEDKLLDFYLEGKLPQETYDLKKAAIDKEISELEATAEKYQTISNETKTIVSNVIAMAGNISNIFDKASIPRKTELLKAFVYDCQLNGDKLEYKLKAPFDKLIACNNYKEWPDVAIKHIDEFDNKALCV